MVIGISGKKTVGKDTVAKIIQGFDIWKKNLALQTEYPLSNVFVRAYVLNRVNIYVSTWEVKKFAGTLKEIVSILTGFKVEDLEKEEIKNTNLFLSYRLLNKKANTFEVFTSMEDLVERLNHLRTVYLDVYSAEEVNDLFVQETISVTPRLLLQTIGTDIVRTINPDIWCNSLFSDYNGDVEKWINIIGYENSYQVSSFGRVKSLDRKIVYGEGNGQYHTKKSQILKPTLSGGYETVSLSGKTFTIHSLVAKHFVKGYQEGFVVNHIDYNKTNNFYKNLEWITQKDNIKHNKTTLRGNFGESQKDAKLDSDKVLRIKKLIEDNILSQNKIAKLFDVSPPTISDIKKGKKWNHVGKDVVKIEPILPIPVPNWIISDVRFPNEVKAIKDKDGLVIRVNRPFYCQGCTIEKLVYQDCMDCAEYQMGILQKEHESETALDSYEHFDYVIDNSNCIDCLIEQVKEILKHEKII